LPFFAIRWKFRRPPTFSLFLGFSMQRLCVLVLVLALVPLAARGETPQDQSSSQSSDLPSSAVRMPDLISFGGSYEGFDKFNNKYSQDGEAHTRATNAIMEYRWGYALWETHNDWSDFGIHPIAGGEVSSHKQLYGFGGFAFDWLVWKHLVLTESEAVGLFSSGNAKPLGSFIEFRSQMELGWRFNDDIRMTALIAHISNAGLTQRNPGEEMLGGYIHIPVHMLFGQ
jgi:hypothetical protein